MEPKPTDPNPNWSEPARRVKAVWEGLIDSQQNPNWMENAEAIGEFAHTLRAAYGTDVGTYELWHVLGGSGVSYGSPCTAYDFPGEDSIENFLDRLAADQTVAEDELDRNIAKLEQERTDLIEKYTRERRRLGM